jgi:hypothetical protein
MTRHLIYPAITILAHHSKSDTRPLDASHPAGDLHSIAPCPMQHISLSAMICDQIMPQALSDYANTQESSLTLIRVRYCDAGEPSSVQWAGRARCASLTLPVATHANSQYTMTRPFDTCQSHCGSSRISRRCTRPFKQVLARYHQGPFQH